MVRELWQTKSERHVQRTEPQESVTEGTQRAAGKSESGLCSCINVKQNSLKRQQGQWKVKGSSCIQHICETGNLQLHYNISGFQHYKMSLQLYWKQQVTGATTRRKSVRNSKRRSGSCSYNWGSTMVALYVILHVSSIKEMKYIACMLLCLYPCSWHSVYIGKKPDFSIIIKVLYPFKCSYVSLFSNHARNE